MKRFSWVGLITALLLVWNWPLALAFALLDLVLLLAGLARFRRDRLALD